jgi:oligosaccharide repeat unit polymerase
MLIQLVFTVCMAGMTAFNYRAGRRNVLYPAFLFSLIWFVVSCLYLVPLVEVDDLGPYTMVVVLCGTAAFSAGATLMEWWPYLRPPKTSPNRNALAKKIIFFFCLAVLPFFALEIRSLSIGRGLEGFMNSARGAIVEAVQNGATRPYSSIYTIATTMSVFVAFIFLIEMREWRKERLWVWGSILTALAFSLLTMGRVVLLELVAGSTGIYLLKRKAFSAKQAWKFVRWPFVAFLVLFVVIALFTKDISNQSESSAGVYAQFTFGYAVMPLAGLDYVLHHASEYQHEPNHTFREILPVVAPFLGIKYTPAPALDEFIEVPLPVNVYTVFKFYYLDFGLSGMLVAMFLIGAGQTWLLRKALTGEHLYVFLFAVSLYPLAMVAFDDQYSEIFGYSKQIIFAVVYFVVLRTIPLGTRARRFPNGALATARSETGAGNSA